ncbi:MAG: hypothetical protein HY328_15620 [Chloroflexi bacterium]|nr:hypothetical protein [Chloroflexota bacterium]
MKKQAIRARILVFEGFGPIDKKYSALLEFCHSHGLTFCRLREANGFLFLAQTPAQIFLAGEVRLRPNVPLYTAKVYVLGNAEEMIADLRLLWNPGHTTYDTQKLIPVVGPGGALEALIRGELQAEADNYPEGEAGPNFPASGGKDELPIPEGDELLTPRQREIAHLLAEGMNYEGIAGRLVISPHTVKKHGDNIQERWGIGGGEKALQIETKRRGYGENTRVL